MRCSTWRPAGSPWLPAIDGIRFLSRAASTRRRAYNAVLQRNLAALRARLPVLGLHEVACVIQKLLHDLVEMIVSPIDVVLKLAEHAPYRNRRPGLSLEPVVDEDVDPRPLDAAPDQLAPPRIIEGVQVLLEG